MFGDGGGMTIAPSSIRTPLARPQADGSAGKRAATATASAVRAASPAGGASATDAGMVRLRRFLESGERPARFVLPGSYLNILV
ncbi:MAG: hypothetical protein IPM60_13500 [Rhodospirillales bacterium]|nr:hypothetical protein [Rhodospirillales bacterium]